MSYWTNANKNIKMCMYPLRKKQLLSYRTHSTASYNGQ